MGSSEGQTGLRMALADFVRDLIGLHEGYFRTLVKSGSPKMISTKKMRAGKPCTKKGHFDQFGCGWGGLPISDLGMSLKTSKSQRDSPANRLLQNQIFGIWSVVRSVRSHRDRSTCQCLIELFREKYLEKKSTFDADQKDAR